ncbi:kinase-associated lipoprotein B [Priestia taiwanensis]|uniref:Kinase-associated protein B n=1 Tax=Priestia taiwanensis TaxID=1347902 RepID=A0A917AVQ4_9BACI|nr:kinase-associated lipoprotein B [Priestia taiwanensis]MBM7364606.1 kinase-associated protein B [Priestia taiwanensis]GGE80184.1 kinase-associated protein B [Priestia taiwanensis]
MSSEQLAIGDIVTGIYKTGKYIGEITNIRPAHYVVRVLSVLKHPTQGDLHNPKETEGVFFHERRALAFREQTNIPQTMVKRYEGDVIEYKESLRTALEKQADSLREDGSEWATKCLENLQTLATEYKL